MHFFVNSYQTITFSSLQLEDVGIIIVSKILKILVFRRKTDTPIINKTLLQSYVITITLVRSLVFTAGKLNFVKMRF